MKFTLSLGCVLTLFLAGPPGTFADDEAALFKTYQGKESIPAGLKKAHAAFVKAGRQGGPESFCLPHAVAITREPRPEKGRPTKATKEDFAAVETKLAHLFKVYRPAETQD